MSRAYKNAVVDDTIDLGGTGLTVNGVNAEKLSGADLEQLRLAARNGSAPSTDANGTKTLGNNVKMSVLATVTADAVNTITVDDVTSLFVGQVIDIRSANGVTVRADNRSITAINFLTKVVTYSGADASGTIVATDIVTDSTGLISNAALSGADQIRYAGDQ